MKLKPITSEQYTDVVDAYAKLLQARESLRYAGSLKAAEAVERALKSVGGAMRHARRRALASGARLLLLPRRF